MGQARCAANLNGDGLDVDQSQAFRNDGVGNMIQDQSLINTS